MRRFRFPLQTVLRLRGQLEKQAQRTLAVAMSAVHEAERKLAFAERGLRECAAGCQQTTPSAALARALEAGFRHFQLRMQRDLKRAQAAAEGARLDYLEKRKDLRSMERLHDRRREEWRDETNRAEQAELDELARLARAARGEETT